jgi:hypothetical protein
MGNVRKCLVATNHFLDKKWYKMHGGCLAFSRISHPENAKQLATCFFD